MMHPLWNEVASVLAIFMAGFVRGYAGFGFSAVSIGLISLWRSPSELVPIIFLLEVPASLLMLRQALRDFSANWAWPLLGGGAIGIPVGVGLLGMVQGNWLQLLVSACICTASVAVRLGIHPRRGDTRAYRWLTGVVSGIFNGLSALGGIVCAVMLFSASIAPRTQRATLTLLFLFTDLYGLLLAWASGLLRQAMLLTAGVWMLPLALGIFLGSRHFHSADIALFRSRVFTLLIALGAAGVAKSLFALA